MIDEDGLRARLAKRTVKSPDTECFLWTGTGAGRGGRYGVIWVAQPGGGFKHEYVHRVAYILAKGEVPAGLHVMHSCDVTRCVNPEHLSVGTNLENHQDAARKGRQPRGERQHLAKLTEQDVRVMREQFAAGVRIAVIARSFPLVNKSNIEHIVHGRTWRHVV